MNIDFSKVFASVNKPDVANQTKQVENVQPLNDVTHHITCECGHDMEDHEGNGDCMVLECACTSLMPPSHKYDVNAPTLLIDNKLHTPENPAPQSITIHQELSPEGELLNRLVAEAQEEIAETVREFISGPTSLQAAERDPSIPGAHKDITVASEDDGCAHLCKCGKWWSHGERRKCRHPDVLDMGLCAECLNGKPQADVLEDFIDGKLTPKGIQNCYNKARVDCVNMNQEQLGYHIEHLAKRIEELRAEAIMSRKMRAELIEEEVQKVPAEEREAFRQELLKGAKKTASKRTPSSKEQTKGPSYDEINAAYKALNLAEPDAKTCKLVAGLMSQMKKSATEIARFLND